MRARFGLRSLLVLVSVIGIFIGVTRATYHTVAGPVIPRRLLNRVAPGMAATDVSRLLGKPSRVHSTEGDSTWETWIYTRPMNVGHVGITFHGESVEWVNDESVFPGFP